jgi:hypothetical protein
MEWKNREIWKFLKGEREGKVSPKKGRSEKEKVSNSFNVSPYPAGGGIYNYTTGNFPATDGVNSKIGLLHPLVGGVLPI